MLTACQSLLSSAYDKLAPTTHLSRKVFYPTLLTSPCVACDDYREFATCNEALQACLSKHKEDNAEVTKKRHKKEVSRLLSNLVTAVTGLR